MIVEVVDNLVRKVKRLSLIDRVESALPRGLLGCVQRSLLRVENE